MEEFDMDDMNDMNEMYEEYNDRTVEELNDNLNDLRDEMLIGDNPLVTERIQYIDNILTDRNFEEETDFGGTVRDDPFIQTRKYVQDTLGENLNSRSDSVLELRRRVGSKNGKITFKVKLRDGSLSTVDSIVLDRNGDVFEKNTAQRNATAVKQFDELINKAVTESAERDITTESFPMVDKTPIQLPQDLMDRLSVADQRIVNGVLDPSDTILPETRIGDKGAIQLTIDEFNNRGEVIREKIKDSERLGDVKDLIQESMDIDTIVDALEEQRVKEEARESQEEDISKFEKFKKWVKENGLAGTAVIVSIAGLVTTVVVGAKKALTNGASGLKKFLKYVKDKISKLGPMAATIAEAAYKLVMFLLKAAGWLFDNLLIVLLAVAYFLYSEYNKKA